MVLGIASMATAGLTFSTAAETVPAGTLVSVGLLSDAAGTSDTSVTGSLDDLALDFAAGAETNVSLAVNALGAPYVGYYQTIGGSNPGYSVGGEVAVMTIDTAGLADGIYEIYTYTQDQWTSSLAENATFTLTVIPEPMTMGLLGLGGLFLRRRK